MFLEEATARESWCPHTQARCEASACMMWRYERGHVVLIPHGYPVPHGYVAEREVTWSTKGEASVWRQCRLSWVGEDGEAKPLRGYCGLAGVPRST